MFSSFFGEIGSVTLNLSEAFTFIAKGKISLKNVLLQTASIGTDSLPVATIICLIAGSVLSLHGAEQFAQTGAHNYVGGLVAIAMVLEMGPIYTAMAVAARAGTGIASEIANMKITNQLDALQLMKVNTTRYLLVPRLIACVVSMPLLLIITCTAGIIGGMITAKATVGIHHQRFLDSVWLNLKFKDIYFAMLKSAIFGILTAGISVTFGFEAGKTARDVGQAATLATIWTAVSVLICDFFLTWIFFGTSILD